MPVAGTELDGFELNGRRIVRRDGRLTLEDGTLAGADIDFPGAIRVLVREGVPLARALRMATVAPARVLGRDDLGRLAPGLAADFVHLDAGLDAARGVAGGAAGVTRCRTGRIGPLAATRDRNVSSGRLPARTGRPGRTAWDGERGRWPHRVRSARS